MNSILQGLIIALAYVDDVIIVYYENEQKHKILLTDLFRRLTKHEAVINRI